MFMYQTQNISDEFKMKKDIKKHAEALMEKENLEEEEF